MIQSVSFTVYLILFFPYSFYKIKVKIKKILRLKILLLFSFLRNLIILNLYFKFGKQPDCFEPTSINWNDINKHQ